MVSTHLNNPQQTQKYLEQSVKPLQVLLDFSHETIQLNLRKESAEQVPQCYFCPKILFFFRGAIFPVSSQLNSILRESVKLKEHTFRVFAQEMSRSQLVIS